MLFEEEIDQNATGKTVDSLKKSKEFRQNFISKYGMVPSSILHHVRGDKAIDFSKDSRKKITRKIFTSDKGERIKWQRGSGAKGGAKDGALSIFPKKIVRLIVKFYCPENGIVYDPFCGHNSRMQLVYECNRNYIGVDVSKEFMKHNREIRGFLLNENRLIENPATITLIEGSSAKVDLPNNYADFTITSPPYWDIEYYGDEPEQLGKNKTYDSFLDSLSLHIRENYRILKPGAFCAWFVNDFRKDGIFYPYHSDLLYFFQEAGFEMFNIYIVDLGNTFGKIFAQQIEKSKIFPKRHEYCLLFQKG